MKKLTTLFAVGVLALGIPATALANGGGDDHGHKSGDKHGQKHKKSKLGWWQASAALTPTTGQTATGFTLLKQRDGSVTVAGKVTKLAPNSRHAYGIYAGTCATPGALALALPDLISGPMGNARLVLTLPTAAGSDLAKAGYFVGVSEGYGATAGALISCGDIKEKAAFAHAKVRSSVAGGTVSGSVSIKQKGEILKVSVSLKGLVPGSVHASHIHVGSCAAQGGIVTPFPDLTADGKGRVRALFTVISTTDVAHSGYYFNLHEAASPTFGGGIACGDLMGTKRPHHPWWWTPWHKWFV